MGITYKDSGVDIETGDEAVKSIKPLIRSTFNANVLSDIGLFGGFYDAKFPDYTHPVLVSSTDGVGTKLKVAFMMNRHDTVGQCLVNHCVNDILCCGAKPLFFLDYLGTGKLETKVFSEIITGFTKACNENECALIGGETAEMPSFYQEGEYDISGTIVGLVEKSKIIDGKRMSKGDILLGLPSTGLHTNGYSLARAVLFPKYKTDTYFDELGTTIGEALLSIHRSYLKSVQPLLEGELVKGISHITGGGIIGNTSRIIPDGLKLNIFWNAWEVPPIFNIIKKEGQITEQEMRHVFNLGIGLVLVVSEDRANEVIDQLQQDDVEIIGNIS